MELGIIILESTKLEIDRSSTLTAAQGQLDSFRVAILFGLRRLSLALPLLLPGIRYRLIRFALRVLQIHSYRFEVDFCGFRYKGDIGNHIDFHLFFLGSYETGILRFMGELISKDAVVFDVGANTGHHSLYLSRLAGQVEAFEPYAPVRRVLDQRIADNGIQNIRIHPIGLGDTDAMAEFFEPPDSNTGIGSFLKSHSFENQAAGLSLPIRRGDAIAEELNLQRVDLIKIDVEDAEDRVLRGLQQVLLKYNPHVVVEVCRANVASADFTSLFPPNYQLFYIRNGFRRSIKLEPFKRSEKPAYVYARPTAVS